MPPHRHCMNCGYFRWLFRTVSGFDCPDTSCPECGLPLIADGHDIPMEKCFLGLMAVKFQISASTLQMKYAIIIIKALKQVFCKIKGAKCFVHRSLPAALSMQKVQNFCKTDISVSDIDSDQIIKTLSDIKCGPIETFHGVYIIPQNAGDRRLYTNYRFGWKRSRILLTTLSEQSIAMLKNTVLNLSEVFTGLHRSTGIDTLMSP